MMHKLVDVVEKQTNPARVASHLTYSGLRAQVYEYISGMPNARPNSRTYLHDGWNGGDVIAVGGLRRL